MEVKLIAYTQDPERVCAAAARSTRAREVVDHEKLSLEGARKTVKRVAKSGHGSVLEHANFTFAINGISRACSHQLVRHRIASYSQQSQRYLRTRGYITPGSVADKPDAQEIYQKGMDLAWETYGELIKMGIEDEDARYVLPNGASTSLVMTMNARSLLNFFRLRLCLRSQWEIRKLAESMLKEARSVAPSLFEDVGPPCNEGYCPDDDENCPLYPG